MSGMVKQTRLRPVLNGAPTAIVYGNRPGDITTYSTTDLKAWENTTSFRSGAAFARAINDGASIASEGTFDATRLSGDTGHPFDHSFERFNTANPYMSLTNRYGGIYRGPVISYPSNFSGLDYQKPWNLSDSALRNLGSGLVNQASPLKAQANVLQSVIELVREGLPNALFSAIAKPGSPTKKELLKRAGSDYLNHMFGLSPLIREIDTLIKTVGSIDKLVGQLVRDSGANVHRRRDIKEVEVFRQNNDGSVYDTTIVVPPLKTHSAVMSYITTNAEWFPAPSSYHRQVNSLVATRRVWFTGSFTYDIDALRMPNHIRDFFDVVAKRGKQPIEDVAREYLLGMGEATIDNALWWELTPFSWLVDWFVNVGVVLDNRRQFDRLGLVMNYGYVMCEETRTTTTTNYINSGPVLTSSWQNVRQRRVRASPFGFGVDTDKLSAYQLSILGALATQGLKE